MDFRLSKEAVVRDYFVLKKKGKGWSHQDSFTRVEYSLDNNRDQNKLEVFLNIGDNLTKYGNFVPVGLVNHLPHIFLPYALLGVIRNKKNHIFGCIAVLKKVSCAYVIYGDVLLQMIRMRTRHPISVLGENPETTSSKSNTKQTKQKKKPYLCPLKIFKLNQSANG